MQEKTTSHNWLYQSMCEAKTEVDSWKPWQKAAVGYESQNSSRNTDVDYSQPNKGKK